jgi:16S rRNA (guanine966-N2)-methyltransferase
MGRHRKVLESEEAASAPRIVGGDLRGRTLEFAPAARTRPMKDRVRETLFDLIGPRVKGVVAIDLFAGTGALGFEALSRGAAEAVFGERHFPTADALRRSARQLGVEGRATVRPGDVLLWTKKLPPLPQSAPWLVFVSPPWSFFSARAAELMALIEALQAAAPAGSVFVVESDDAFDAAGLPAAGWKSRPIPPAVLHFWSRPA